MSEIIITDLEGKDGEPHWNRNFSSLSAQRWTAARARRVARWLITPPPTPEHGLFAGLVRASARIEEGH